ncbi:CAP domain-containing protein [Psychromonas sp. PT13]|uniref:CAP domain-containing protein n=1 Tax=Psychromonas sp. PT13 TaxID=3439547 RepID=UPI003EBE1182
MRTYSMALFCFFTLIGCGSSSSEGDNTNNDTEITLSDDSTSDTTDDETTTNEDSNTDTADDETTSDEDSTADTADNETTSDEDSNTDTADDETTSDEDSNTDTADDEITTDEDSNTDTTDDEITTDEDSNTDTTDDEATTDEYSNTDTTDDEATTDEDSSSDAADDETTSNEEIDYSLLSCESDLTSVLTLINEKRTTQQTCGDQTMPAVDEVTWNDALTLAAQSHSESMANFDYFDHTGIDDSTVGTRVTDQGYSWSYVSENIAAGQTTAQNVVDAWMGSDGHCKNIMSENVTEMGLACASNSGSTYNYYWTQVFAKPR